MNKILFENKEHKQRLCSLKKRLSEETQMQLIKHSKGQLSFQKEQKFLKEQNDLFYNSYFEGTSHLKQVDLFTELKQEYTNKGYKIPDLSLLNSNNLFKSNPLLLVNGRDIDLYYAYKSKETAKTERPKRYLLKLQKTLNQRVNNIGKKKVKEFFTFCTIRTDEKECIDAQSNQENINENCRLKKYNKMIEDIMESEKLISIIEKKIIDKGKGLSNKSKEKKLRMSHNLQYDFSEPSEDNTNTRLESLFTDMTLSLMNNRDRQNNHCQNTTQTENKTQSQYFKQSISNSSNTQINCSLSNCKRNSVLGKITKRNSNVSTVLLGKVFETKQKFFEYLREINIATLTFDSLLTIVKEYLRNIKEWKEETIKQFLSSESVIREMTGLVLDFSLKITHYDILRNIPDKTKISNAQRLYKTDTIAKGLPKYIIKRMIIGASCKRKQLHIE